MGTVSQVKEMANAETWVGVSLVCVRNSEKVFAGQSEREKM